MLDKIGRWLPVALLVILVTAFLVVYVDAYQQAQGHPVDELYVPSDPDSMKVMLEVDADDDGVWEIRHVFFDKTGVWDQSSDGRMRVTWTKFYPNAPDTTRTELGYFWRDLWDTPGVTIKPLDLQEWSQFGQAYGAEVKVFPSGLKMFESPRYWWYMYPNPDSTATQEGQ